MTTAATGGTAHAWCEDPQPWFSCPDCGDGLYWADFAHGQLLICANHQCFGAGTEIPVWRAQQHREDRGLDHPAPGPGWPRPILGGRPVPYIVPVTAGHPWWRLTHGPRLLRCQNDWCCQVCGDPLDPTAWVLIDDHGAVETDAAAHQHCLQHALRSCPHLMRSAATSLHAIPVQRSDIHVYGSPLSIAPAVTREPWMVPRRDVASTSCGSTHVDQRDARCIDPTAN